MEAARENEFSLEWEIRALSGYRTCMGGARKNGGPAGLVAARGRRIADRATRGTISPFSHLEILFTDDLYKDRHIFPGNLYCIP
jgi:hypothetical protein